MPQGEYSGVISSAGQSGEVKLTVGRDELTAMSPFDATLIPYADMTAFELRDWAVSIHTDSGDTVELSRLGGFCDPFYNELCDAYNKKMLKALFVDGNPLFETKGEYRFDEGGRSVSGRGRIQVYDNCVCVLSPDGNSRRIPLCFLTGMNRSDFELTLTLDTGERYGFIRLGYDTEPFERCITERLFSLREKTIAAVRETDTALPAARAAAIAKLIPEGTAAESGQLAAIAPSFVAALESKIGGSRAAESYAAFRSICDPARICIGFKRQFSGGGVSGNVDTGEPDGGADAFSAVSGDPGPEKSKDGIKEDTMLWMIAPGQNGNTAAVEFAVEEGESAATFIYRFDGGWDAFRRSLNRALEAIGFKREIIRLTGEELNKPEFDHYKMAVRHTPSLRFIRERFAGRVIHSTPESWQREIRGYLE